MKQISKMFFSFALFMLILECSMQSVVQKWTI